MGNKSLLVVERA